jgi:1-acyl-sn-glycerol-3-phosphate acyltransferase
MARDTLFKKGLGEWFMKGVAAFPISRDRGDVGALKKCVHLLKSGDCVGIFPEGTRSRDGQLKAIKPGIGFLIVAAGVPVVPAYIHGTFDALPRGAKWPRPRPIQVHHRTAHSAGRIVTVFGKGRDSYEKVAQLVFERIKALQPTST